MPRYHKLSFPMYDGKEDPLGWFNCCEHFFNAQRTRNIDKVWLASFHLLGPLQQWYYVIERDTGAPSWEEFKQLCHQRFSPPLTTNHLAELARLPFTTDVATYLEAFLACLAHVGRLTLYQQAQLFLGGLPEHIRIESSSTTLEIYSRPCAWHVLMSVATHLHSLPSQHPGTLDASW